MQTVPWTVFIFAIGFGAAAHEPQADDARKKAVEKALETFSGTWDILETQPQGVTQEARQLVFRKDMSYSAVDKDGRELWAGTFDLDPAASPKIWDHRSNEAKKTGGDALGIYELDGDKLKVACVAGTWKDKQWTGKPRPTEFKLPDAEVVMELRRRIR